jgi:hypothetical protein
VAGASEQDDEQPVDRLWSERPWAATFDLIASEYGWTDEQILDLTLGRMRQIREVILMRRDADYRRTVRLEEMKVRNIVAATFAAAGNRKGARGAEGISFLPPDEAEKKSKVASIKQVSKVFPVDSNPKYGLVDMAEVERRAAEIRSGQREVPL